MKRLLLTLAQNACPFSCRYCFADFADYIRPPSIEDVARNPSLLQDIDVVYPSCDVDLFAVDGWSDILARVVSWGRSISISTKARLTSEVTERLTEFSEQLASQGKILKIGVSISTKTFVKVIEPGTASFQTRIANLKLLRECGIASCAVLKPILAEVGWEEYGEIVNEASGHTSVFLIGDEYVDGNSPRPLGKLTKEPEVISHSVNWATNKPMWPARHDGAKVAFIRSRIRRAGCYVFESDNQLMEHLLEGTNINVVRSTARRR